MTAKAIMDARQSAAVSLQRLVFRAHQKNGFVTIEDCAEVTDQITIAVIAAFSEYLRYRQEEQNESVAH